MKTWRRCAPLFSCYPRKTAGGGVQTPPSRAKVKSAVLLYTHCFYHWFSGFLCLTSLSSEYYILYYQYIVSYITSTYILFYIISIFYFMLFPILCEGIWTFILLVCQESSSVYYLLWVWCKCICRGDGGQLEHFLLFGHWSKNWLSHITLICLFDNLPSSSLQSEWEDG